MTSKTSGGLVRLMVAVDEELYEYIEEEAKKNERTVSGQARYMLKKQQPSSGTKFFSS